MQSLDIRSLTAVRAGFTAALLAIDAVSFGVQRPALAEPLAQPAVAAIVQAIEDHRLVAIGETHRNQQVHDLLVTLLRDPAFLPKGGDVVVECGNARYQSVMDRYAAGERVPREELAHVWRETVNILVWDAPVYERLFATVRSVNQGRASRSRLRVVLADPPIEWSTIHDRISWERIADSRDRHAADVIEREVLTRGRRALLIFGSGHVQNENAFDRYGKSNPARAPNLAELLQDRHPGATFFVMADWMTRELDARLARWRPPALARLKGTWLGDVHVGPPSGTPRLEDLADAFLYLGPTFSLTTSTPSSKIYSDAAYLRELLRRNAIQGGANTAELQRLETEFLGPKRPQCSLDCRDCRSRIGAGHQAGRIQTPGE